MKNGDTCAGDQPGEKGISPQRKAGRSTFAALLHDFFTANSARNVGKVARWAGVWGVCESKVRQWAQPLRTTAAITCGDVQALPAKDRAALLAFWLERTQAELAPVAPLKDARHVALSAVVVAGNVAAEARDIMADGRIDDEELRRFEAKCDEGEQLYRTAKLAARAARGER